MEQMPIGVMLGVGENPEERLRRVKEMGIPTVQMGCPPQQWWSGEKFEQLKKAIAESGITVTTVFMGFPGEGYADIPTVRRTVGLVPPETRAQRLESAFKIVDFAAAIGVKRAAAHIGFVPEDEKDPLYAEVIEAARKVADRCKSKGLVFALETGQETGPTLKRFIGDLNRDNIRVNFDPANMILYGSGEPIAALKIVGQWVDGVHCKDGKWPTEGGKLGHEMPLGEGEVGIENFVKTLVEIGYRGPLTIEREISGEQQARDIMKAKTLLEGLRKKYLGCC
jgi:sugar phosphate isomerase/epimerase